MDVAGKFPRWRERHRKAVERGGEVLCSDKHECHVFHCITVFCEILAQGWGRGTPYFLTILQIFVEKKKTSQR